MTSESTVVIAGVTMTMAAARNVEEVGQEVAADVQALRSGTVTRETLLAHCLDGADPDREQGWREYVEAAAAAAAAMASTAAAKLGAEDAAAGREPLWYRVGGSYVNAESGHIGRSDLAAAYLSGYATVARPVGR